MNTTHILSDLPKIIYPVLSEEQLRKLPWNRLKNIMGSVRASISSIENYWGRDSCDVCVPPVHLWPEFETWEQRDAAMAWMLKPHYEYFQLLKQYAALLPHAPKTTKLKIHK